MKFLLVGVKRNPQVARLREEAEGKGHFLEGCYTSELTVSFINGKVDASLRGKSLQDFDLIYLWTLGKRRWEWIEVCKFLSGNFGTVVVNKSWIEEGEKIYNPSCLRSFFIQARKNLPFPRTYLVFSTKSLGFFLKNSDFTFPMIVKSGEGRQGKKVFKVLDEDMLLKVVGILEKEKAPILIREFIPNDGDIRVFTIGYKAVAAMRRIPPKGDFRSNISVGGRGKEFDLKGNPRIKEIAEKASKYLGVEIAGVDIMIDKRNGKPYILEVNPGPQFMGLEKYTQKNIANKIINYFEEKVLQKKL